MSAPKIVAIAEAFRQAFRTPEGDRIIHCIGSFTGADWGLAGVVWEITHARKVNWERHWTGHELNVVDRAGMGWRFDLRHPFDPACDCDRCLDIWTGMKAEAAARS